MEKFEVAVTPVAAPRSALKSAYDKVLVTGAVAVPFVLPFAANAADSIDTSAVITTIGLGAAAVGALGAAKIAPAALTWVWSLVTGMAKRG